MDVLTGRLTVTARRLLDAIDPCVTFARNGLTPDPWQATILRQMPRMALIVWGRQVGKSLCFGADGLHTALYRPGSRILMASFNHDKAKEMLAKAAELYPPWEKEVALVAQTTERLVFANGSVIDAIPAKPSSARGPTARKVYLDEAFLTSYELFSTIFPTLMRTGGTLVALSTAPKDPAGWFWEAYTQAGSVAGEEAHEKLSDMWLRSYVPSTMSPYATPEHLDQARSVMLPDDFAREYECRFPKVGGRKGSLLLPDLSDLIANVFTDEPREVVP